MGLLLGKRGIKKYLVLDIPIPDVPTFPRSYAYNFPVLIWYTLTSCSSEITIVGGVVRRNFLTHCRKNFRILFIGRTLS